MFKETPDLAEMAEALSRSTDYRVLRRLVPRTTSPRAIGQDFKTGVLLDTETTGLDHRKDELIELGMVKFDYAFLNRTPSPEFSEASKNSIP